MSLKKRVMVIAHFCDYGEESSNNRFNYIANMLHNAGLEVELVTSSFSHRDKWQRQGKSYAPYQITLIHEPSYHKNVSLKRLLYSHPVMANNLKRYLVGARKPDVIYCAIPSIHVAEVASKYAGKNQIPFILDVQDLWPEAYKLILRNDKLYQILTCGMQRRVNCVYASADTLVAVSDKYLQRAQYVNKKGSNHVAVYLGTDMSDFDNEVPENDEWIPKKNGEVWIAYCGTLGHSYNLNIVFRALKGVDPSLYKFIIMGSGPLEEAFKKTTEAYGINAVFTGKLKYPEMCTLLRKCDIAVNPIVKGAAQSIINKHGDYAMAGLPVVSTQEPGEYSNLLESYHCGVNCDSESADEVRSAILDLLENEEKRRSLGRNSRRLASEKFDRRNSYAPILDAVQRYLI